MRLSTVFRFALCACFLGFFGVVSAAADPGYRLVPSPAGGYTLDSATGAHFMFRGYYGFYDAWRNPDGSHTLRMTPAKRIIVEKDGSLFSYGGNAVFFWVDRASDGSTAVSLPDPSDGVRESLVEADGTLFSLSGRTAFDEISRDSDGSTHVRYSSFVSGEAQGQESLVEADGAFFSFSGRTAFFSVGRNSDGSTTVNLFHDFPRFLDRYSIVERDGSLFSLRGLTAFPRQIWRSADGSTTITTNHGYILAEKDGTLFSYAGRSEFLSLWRQSDGSTALSLASVTDPETVPAQVLLLRDGTLFSYRGRTRFYSVERGNDGETYVYEPALRLKTTIFPNGMTAVTKY